LVKAARLARVEGSRTVGLQHLLAVLRASGGTVGKLLSNFDLVPLAERLANPGVEPTTVGVYLLNDRSSTMVDVVALLTGHFGLDPVNAFYTMLVTEYRGYVWVPVVGAGKDQNTVEEATRAAREVGCSELTFTNKAPDTAGWVRNEQGLLPPETTDRLAIG
jgi:ATP-dependent Clp protease adapter protein ClpS